MPLQQRWSAGVIFYNDRDGLKRCLDSLHNHVDHIFCIDGRFKHFPSTVEDSGLSTDGSRELVIEYYPNTVLMSVPNALEIDKRNRYLALASNFNCDFLLVIDSDEWVEGDWNEFKKNAQAVAKVGPNAVEIRNRDNQFNPRPSLFYKPTLFMYYQKHNRVKRLDTDEILQLNASYPLIPGIIMREDDKLRSAEHVKASFDYQTWLIGYEEHLQ